VNRKTGIRLRRNLARYLAFWAAVLVRLTRPRVVAVTGSVGKTTTTAVIAAVLAQPEAVRLVGSVRTNTGNLNDNLGLPLALLGFRTYPNSGTQMLRVALTAPVRALLGPLFGLRAKTLVLEFAAGWGTSMRRHTRIAPPAVAVVTAIGPAHLERYGTVERVAEEKGLLVSAVPASGLVVLGADNPWAAGMERLAAGRVVKVPGRGIELSQHMARVVAEFFGLPADMVERGLASVPPPRARLQTLELGSMTVINDAFNANPLSMRLALDILQERAQQGRRKVAILGNMAELGAAAPEYHTEIAKYAKARADVVIAVGELARLYDADHWFANSRDCASVIHKLLHRTDLVLVKGSHGVHLNRVVRRLAKRFAAGKSTGAEPHAPVEQR
jgi:UDP-N-acetylmuramoyl-tripeptide--D-alanyl-D-alanine ligase